jgi:opacity protein-like surface antigen
MNSWSTGVTLPFVAAAQLVVAAAPSHAQATPPTAAAVAAAPATDDERWHFALTPYLWASSMSGEASFKGLPPQPVDVSWGDIWSNLDFGALAGFEAHNGRWGVATDTVFMNLGATVPLPDVLGQREPGVDSRQFVFEGDLLYRVFRGVAREGVRASVDLVAGARYNKVSVQLESEALPDTKRSFDWVDGVVGARFVAPLTRRLALAGRADIAGLGSDFTWQAYADLRCRLSPHWTVGAGYRYLDTDYDEGSGTDRKLWSIVNKGPYAGVQVSW